MNADGDPADPTGDAPDAATLAAGGREGPTTPRRASSSATPPGGRGCSPYARVLERQAVRLDGTDTEASLDSELSLVRWGDYDRRRWQPNALFYGVPQKARDAAPAVLMVARLDGPTPVDVRKLMAASLVAERDGLRGKVVVDSRGLRPAGDAYGQYDQTLRNLANLLRTRTALDLVEDDAPEVIQPGEGGAKAVDGVAVYCGWYSVNRYVPAFSFVNGAVAFHVASFELTTLRNPANRGWAPNLLRDGVAATVGPVAEPYLQSFPRADDFFPLLLTGRLTLAEVYWRTVPWTSWRQVIVGDPLYTPFRTNSAMKPGDLPQRLRALVPDDAAATRPAA